MKSWGLLDKILCVVFQAWSQAITKALPGRRHQNAALLTPAWGHSCASQSEGGCTQGPGSPSLLTFFRYFHSKPNTFTSGSWGLRWGLQMPLQRPPYEGRRGSQEDTFPTLAWYPVLFHSCPFPLVHHHNLRGYKTARVFCSGLREQWNDPQVFTDPADPSPGHSSTEKIKEGESVLSSVLVFYLNYGRKWVKP